MCYQPFAMVTITKRTDGHIDSTVCLDVVSRVHVSYGAQPFLRQIYWGAMFWVSVELTQVSRKSSSTYFVNS